MTKPSTAWKKGQSGNPAGRPPKSRALTDLLEKTGSKTVEVDDKKIPGKQLLAQLLWSAATTGRIRFPDGSELVPALQDWLAIVQFIYSQVDGPPKREMDLTSAGEPIRVVIDK